MGSGAYPRHLPCNSGEEEGIASILVRTYRPGTLSMLECRFNKTTFHTHKLKLKRHKTPKGYANFVVYHDCDRTEAQHTLCFASYNDDEVENSPISTWVLLDKAPGPA